MILFFTMSFIKSLLLAAAAVASVSARRGPEPKYPPAAGTSSYCSYWVDYEGDKSCSRVLEDNVVVLKDFARWVRPYFPLSSVHNY